MIEIKHFDFQNKKILKISNFICKKVFVEEQHVDPELEYENKEQGRYNLLLSNGNSITTALL